MSLETPCESGAALAIPSDKILTAINAAKPNNLFFMGKPLPEIKREKKQPFIPSQTKENPTPETKIPQIKFRS